MLNQPPDRNPSESPKTPAQPVTLHIPSVTPVVTVSLLIVCALMWLVRILNTAPADVTLSAFALQGDALLVQRQYYRLLTSLLLLEGVSVVGILQALLSLYTLYIVGIPTEKLWGSLRMGLVYVLGGLSGAVLSVLSVPLGILDINALMVSAPNAIMALVGAELVYLYKHRVLYRQKARIRQYYLAGLAVLNLLVGAFAPHVDLLGMLAGIGGGALLAAYISPYMLPRQHPDHPNALIADDGNPLRLRWVALSIYSLGVLGIFALAVNLPR